MDEESSSPIFPIPSLAASASTSSQPTYTTAGTIYNPSSSQRLQPPTRRGRLLKATSDITAHPSSNTYPIFPPDGQLGRSMPLSVKFAQLLDLPQTSSTSLTLPPQSRQIPYKPLQQNYDRAVSPMNAPDQEIKMQSMTPQLAIHIFDALRSKGAAIDASSSDDEDATVTSALMNMTVKSLQNLASYPNPNQKSAQKALLRGTKPRAGSVLGGPSRLGTPSAYRNVSPIGGGVSLREETSSGLRHTLSDPATLRQHFTMARPRKLARHVLSEAAPNAGYQTVTASSRLSTPSIHSDNSDPNPWASMSLATGVGAPKPLTAGPPGQRQYRPSTFESTFKALHTTPTASQDSTTQLQEEDDYHLLGSLYNVINATPETSQDYTGEDQKHVSGLEMSSEAHTDIPTACQNSADKGNKIPASVPYDTLQGLIAGSDPEGPFGSDMLRRSSILSGWLPYGVNSDGKVDMFYYSEEVQNKNYFGPMDSYTRLTAAAPSLSELWSSFDSNEVCEPTTPMFPQSMGYAAGLTEAEIQERNLRLNIHWYAGTGLLGDAYPLPKPIAVDTYPPVATNIYGAVGDGRPTQDSSAGGGGGEDWPAKNMSSQPGDDSIMNGLALLGEVLSRAI
ncbi:hypothetical protein ACHAQJ_009553 [Trichoderma viride]